MEQPIPNDRLSRISTAWSLMAQAHAGQADAATQAQHALMQRYCGAVYRYLLGALCDAEAAMELFQEFALRFLRGDFHRADSERGRFRDYVKTALIHLVTDYHRARAAQPRALPADVAAAPESSAGNQDADFGNSWREELLNRTWEALADTYPFYHAVLLHHVQHPDESASEMKDKLSAQLGKALTATHVRVTMHRAREKFAALLVEEVRQSLETPNDAELLQELRVLRLAGYCAAALERR